MRATNDRPTAGRSRRYKDPRRQRRRDQASPCRRTSRRGPASSPSCTSRGTTSMFVLHGNTYDVVRAGDKRRALARPRRVPGRAAVRPLGPRPPLRPRARPALHRRHATASGCRRWSRSRTSGSATCARCRAIRRRASLALDLLVQKNVMADPDDRIRTAVIIDHVRLRRAERRPPRSQRADAARDAAQLGVEPARQAPEHGVRADRPAAVERHRAADRQPARRDDRGAAARRRRARPRSSARRSRRAARRSSAFSRLQRRRARQADRRHRPHRPQGARAVARSRAGAGSTARTSASSRSG